MLWQDIVLTISNFLFTYSLIPQVLHGFKTKKTTILSITALLTVIGLYSGAIATFTLDLYFAAIIMAVNGTLWLFLLIQAISYKK